MKKVCFVLALLLCAAGSMAQTGNLNSGISETYALLSINGGADTYYDLQATSGSPDFNGAFLGSFSTANPAHTLVLRGGQNSVYKCTGGNITAGGLYYRVYKTGSPPGSFSSVALSMSFEATNGCGGKDQIWEEVAASVNLLSGLVPGVYTLEIYSTADYDNTAAGDGTGTWNANNSGNNYKATFNRLPDPANPVSVSASGGTAFASYPNFGSAFSAINSGTHTGSISILLAGNTGEPATGAVLNGSGTGAASYTGINITPLGNASINGATNAGLPMIDLNGADNVVIDGINSGGHSLVISNTQTATTAGTATIRFQGDATGNTITNCTVLGSSRVVPGTNGATVVFGAAAVATGNDNNTISNCTIGPAGANLPVKAIYCTGSSNTDPGTSNNGIVINNNNIYDYANITGNSAGIDVNSGTTGITISNNRFYQTASRTISVSAAYHRAININNTASANIQITGNTIGYANSSGTGIYAVSLGSTCTFTAIALTLSNTGIASVQGNTIAGIAISGLGNGTGAGAPLKGIHVTSGPVSITGNTIGSMTTTGSITFTTSGGSFSEVICILNTGASGWTTSNNNIGGITGNNIPTDVTRIYCMRGSTASGASWVANNNIIGGTIANSIRSSTTNQFSSVHGIDNSGFALTANNNTIRNLSANGGIYSNLGASVAGIIVDNTSPSATHNMSQNVIYNLGNTSTTGPSFITGIHIEGGLNNMIQRNLVYDFSIPNNTHATSQANGIYAAAGTSTYQNNMIRLGAGIVAVGPTGGIFGIDEASGTNKFYHNSVYIEGGPAVGAGLSSAFITVATTNTRSIQNNIFVNTRNSTAGGKNYAIRFSTSGVSLPALTMNNNIYFVSGTGGVFGYFNNADVASLAAWQAVTGKDGNSFQSNPNYVAPAAATPDLHINRSLASVAESNGVDVGVVDDYDGETRASFTPVDIGADAFNIFGYCPLANAIFTSNISGSTYQWQVDPGSGFTDISNGGVYSGANTITLTLTAPPTSMNNYKFRCLVNGTTFSNVFTYKVGVTWIGVINTNWNVPGNWSCGIIPDEYTNVEINTGAPNYPITELNVTIWSLKVNPAASVTIGAGFNMTLKGF